MPDCAHVSCFRYCLTDKSVLENYHCAYAFQLLQQEELNFLEGSPCRNFVVVDDP